VKYLDAEDFKGARFIDVGCGSGLFSFAALLLGCSRVVSFDFDPECLMALEVLRDRFQHVLPGNWQQKWSAFRGDILDDSLVNQLRKSGDIVYSWGVLHHTGDMWKAIQNAASLVASNGVFIISIYNHAPGSPIWKNVKRFYNNHPWWQPLLGLAFAGYVVAVRMLYHRRFDLYRERGMHVFYDAIDWIGGYPYEYACFDEVKDFVEKLGFSLIKSPTVIPCGKGKKPGFWDVLNTRFTGCNEFVFRRVG
jgi:2-polyprenyl-6-hydroxyphenyl methylase/3-demethylubiquinone-9 3-methyltransferase